MTKLIFSLTILFATTGGAFAAPVLLTDGTGQVVGATGIFIQNGSFSGTFDVSFEDGSCASLYGGCDDNSDFDGNPPQVSITDGVNTRFRSATPLSILQPIGETHRIEERNKIHGLVAHIRLRISK